MAGENWANREQDAHDFDRDGVICLRKVFDQDWVDRLRVGCDRIAASPSARSAVFNSEENTGKFFGDIWMWRHDQTFRDLAFNSPLPEIARGLMRSERVYLGWDQLFMKEPHTPLPTPWHQDQPYAWIDGYQNCNFWIALDHADRRNGVLEFVRGSHKGPWYAASRFQPNGGTYANSDLVALPDIEADRDNFDIACWEVEPGDVIAHHLNTLHYANGNLTDQRRRAVAVRYAGDDARYAVRKDGPPILYDIGKEPGDPIECELFPRVLG